jgi:hypothetical protein
LFRVPCDTEFPPVKLSTQASVERNAGQFEGSGTGAGPVSPGFMAVASVCVVPFDADANAVAVKTPRLPIVSAADATATASRDDFLTCPPLYWMVRCSSRRQSYQAAAAVPKNAR